MGQTPTGLRKQYETPAEWLREPPAGVPVCVVSELPAVAFNYLPTEKVPVALEGETSVFVPCLF